jgi:hypothetical protein
MFTTASIAAVATPGTFAKDDQATSPQADIGLSRHKLRKAMPISLTVLSERDVGTSASW